jgi:hypothetical protein
MAGMRGKSGPPGNQNAFRHGLAGIAQRRADGILNPTEQSIRKEILFGLVGRQRAEPRRSALPCRCWPNIASDVSLFAIETLSQTNGLQEVP